MKVDDQDDLLSNFTLNVEDELLATKKIPKYFPDSHISMFIIKLPLLSLEESLSCIPPPITYSPDCVTSKTTTKGNGDPPASVQLWSNFFDKVDQFRFDQQPRFEMPKFDDRFIVLNEEDVRVAIHVNICLTLNDLIGPEYDYSKRPPNTPGIPDFTCHLVGSLIFDMVFSPPIIITGSYVEKPPPVLKAYSYLTRRAKKNLKSPKPQVVVPVQGDKDNNSRTLRSHSNSLSSEGRSGKTLLCEFRGNTIALKSVDLSKAPPYVLEEMQKEVEIYKDLADIQGKYIPKFVCYGYYGGGMSFIIGMTIVGTTLNDHKITKRQRSRAIKGLEAIHKHGILHNDIREENILINDNGDIYLIDFGIASRADTKRKRNLFEKEQLKYSNFLDRYKA
ncbi:hypothetical protein RclHR1_00120032 [Rhizophagus clarus]|uniref:Protein kinase domain-containing protein n=1 Tax=Rhizophagus clarus TaxID=94130 RepID=A0A2Z6QXT8_9GLOM|nr:hypothetical protein RclHR1_00120032 [Rhizophagus clarus]